MEAADFNQQSGIPELAFQAGGRHGLDRAAIRLLEEMMRNSFDSELIGRARAAADRNGRVLRELPFVRPLRFSGEIEDGKIDLLFEEEGEWIVVDYKTDGIPEKIEDIGVFFREKYAGQLQAYAGAVSSLGMKVKGAYLLLARTGRQIDIPLPIADFGFRIAD
jgi:ATP-dependent helicase/nuclease subunit A